MVVRQYTLVDIIILRPLRKAALLLLLASAVIFRRSVCVIPSLWKACSAFWGIMPVIATIWAAPSPDVYISCKRWPFHDMLPMHLG